MRAHPQPIVRKVRWLWESGKGVHKIAKIMGMRPGQVGGLVHRYCEPRSDSSSFPRYSTAQGGGGSNKSPAEG